MGARQLRTATLTPRADSSWPNPSARANEDHPDLVVDSVATLTGACVVALGDRTAGLMATDDATADLVLDAAQAAGEDIWQLPIPEEIRSKLDSKVADLRSTGPDRWAAALVACCFSP